MIKNRVKNFLIKNEYLVNYLLKSFFWLLICWFFLSLPWMFFLLHALSSNKDNLYKLFYNIANYSIAFVFSFLILIIIIIIIVGYKLHKVHKNHCVITRACNREWYTQGKEKQLFILYLKIKSWIIFLTQLFFSALYLILPWLNFHNNPLYSWISLLFGILGMGLNIMFFYYFYVKVDFKQLK